MKINRIYNFLILLAFSFLITSCSEEVRSSFVPKPNAFGKLNDVVVIADKNLMESIVGDTLSYFFESAYPIMPTPEPMFDIRTFSPEELEDKKLRKELRTFVIVADVNNESSPTTQMLRKDLGEERFLRAKSLDEFNSSVGMDKWANGQLLIYLFGRGANKVCQSISQNYPAVAARIHKHDEAQLKANIYAVKNNNAELNQEVVARFGIDFNVPPDYKRANTVDDDNIIWMKRDKNSVEQDIVVRKFKYTDPSQLNLDNLIKMRDEYGQKYIHSSTEGSYMRTHREVLPVYDYEAKVDGHYAIELRGTWEMTDDYMGGPFVSFAILNEKKGEIIFLDGFVYGPGSDKRDLVQQLVYIFKNATLVDVSAPKS
ncbi:MAG: DUF4837 family protein [Saprospiraceae bacterium]|nr:DUF4837 family protein [Saprospiraceae bacterium]